MVQEMYYFFFHPQKKQRNVIAVDETKVKLEGRQIYIWNVIDIKDHVEGVPWYH